MPTLRVHPEDAHHVRDIQRQINHELPLAWAHGGFIAASKHSPKYRSRTWDGFCQNSAFGCFLSPSGSVVGLALSECSLETVPFTVLQLQNLQRLNISHNRITSLPTDLLNLRRLEIIQASHNNIPVLPRKLLKSRFKISVKPSSAAPRTIVVFFNPIESPPMEILEQGPDALRQYLRSLEKTRHAPPRLLDEAKLIVVGDGGAGKTSIANRLLGKPFDPHQGQTHGIHIHPWVTTCTGRPVKLHLWDFGGQDIMHATHQFFLSQRSLYMLVLDGRTEQDPQYWLKHIESFGGQSPILVALNKIDDNPAHDVNRKFLQRKFPSIVGFYRLSAKTDQGLDDLKLALTQALEQVDILSTPWPDPWFQVKQRLEAMTDSFISYDAYVEICQSAKIADTPTQQTLVQFLHDLGVIVHFPDFRLSNTHVLEPRWLTTAVYRIINSKTLADAQGLLDLHALPDILQSQPDGYVYPRDKHPYIIDLMKKFQLCYPLGHDRVLIPDLLPVQEPTLQHDVEDALRFRVDYDFLPRSIIARFIVRMHHLIHDGLQWRTGVVLHDPTLDATAAVRADDAAKCIEVELIGQHRRELLTVIRWALLDIHRAYEKLTATERVPLPDQPDVAVSFNHLLLLERTGTQEFIPEGAEQPYRVADLLGNLYVDAQFSQDQFIQMLQAVIHRDTDEKTAHALAQDIVVLQPNFMGMGIDIKKAVRFVLDRWRKN